MKLNWNFQSGGEGILEKNPFHEGGTCTGIFWNYTMNQTSYTVGIHNFEESP